MSEMELSQMIEAAFTGMPPPESSQLIDSNSFEATRIRDFFSGKKWQEITLSALQNDYAGDGSACLWFMTPDAVAYYLPAYLKISALHYIEADSIASELISKLLLVASGEVNNIASAIDTYDLAQNRVIAHLLKRVATEHETEGPFMDATEALNLRWHKYL